MTVEQIEKEEDKLKEEISGASYSAEPLEVKYYLRALDLQAKKIECQGLELSRMNRVYNRDINATRISEAIGFLLKVIIKKIKK